MLIACYYYRLHCSLVNCALDRLVLHLQCPNNVIDDHFPFRSIAWSSLLCRLVVALMPPPLILSTLPPPLNAQPWPIEAPSPLVHWHLSSHLPLVHWLVVTSPVVACLRLVSPFVTRTPHASILDPSSLFPPAGCHVAASRCASISRLAVSSPLPMRRCSCCQCAGVFIVVAIAIVTLITHR